METKTRKGISFIYDEELEEECNRVPSMLNRSFIVQDLINSYSILKSDKVLVVKSEKATENDLKEFHSTQYIDFLKKANNCEDIALFDEEQLEHGLGYDCPLLEKHFDFMCRIAGGTLTAVKLLSKGVSRVAINWFGGWHHAQRDEPEGFCYVNDIVLGIQKLQKSFSKVLYIDLDVHHGDGVQNAFEFSKNVLTLSFHKKEVGFFPGSGSLEEIGSGIGMYYTLNAPFLNGISDKSYLILFEGIFERVYNVYSPAVIVVQCGGDILVGDPLGQCNVTLNAMTNCVKRILNCGIPCLILGGGGYNFPNTARYWTSITALALGVQLDEDIPDSSEYFPLYSPTYELNIEPGNQKDYNTEEYLNTVIGTINKYCDCIAKMN